MIDDKVIKQLDSPDPEQRKKAIAALARTKDVAVLKYLAVVVKTDRDPEVAELARKAGVYIKKNAPVQPASPPISSQPTPSTVFTAHPLQIEGSDEAEMVVDEAPLPSQIVVSKGDIERANGYVQQAIDWHMRENNDKAAQYLRRAFGANPKLQYDGYTQGLAASITGLPTDEAVRVLIPSGGELQKRVARPSTGETSVAQRLVAFLVLAAAIILLVSYFLFTWIDLTPITLSGPGGEEINFGQVIAQANTDMENTRKQFEALRTQIPSDQVAQFNRLYDALNTRIQVSFSGLDTMLVSLGLRDIYEVMGLSTLFEVIREFNVPGFDVSSLPQSQIIPHPLDYTLALVPVVGLIALIVALGLMSRSPSSTSTWILVVVVGLIGMAPFWWFFTNVRDELLSNGVDLSALGQEVSITNISTGTEVIGPGFWMGLAAQLAVIVLPLIAMLMQPSADEGK